ncbi:MAG TPA: 5-oxoprolinase subunit PxpA [Polyangiaceae bacterium]
MALLNVDLGELPDEDEALYASAHLANVACGGHAGDAASMRLAAERCRRHGTRLGAHPSYPDRDGFGRRHIAIDPAALRASVAAQCRALVEATGERPRFVKAHGALYHAARDDEATASALVAGAREALGDAIALLGPAAGALRACVEREGLGYLREGFADRGTRPDGTLVPRGEPGALVTDAATAASNAVALARSGAVDTICVHGDTPGAVLIARAVRDALDACTG